MNDQNTGNSQELKSKYNAAIAQLYRLDELWKDAHTHSRKHEFQKWNLDLDAIWRELAETETQKNDNEKEYDRISEEIIKTGINMIPQTTGFQTPSNQYRIMLGKLYFLLNKKEIFLRRLQHHQGKGSVYEDSDDEYGD